jgi:plasmid stabilization system protein ParE
MSLPVRVKSVADAEYAEGAVWYHRRSEKAAAAFIAAVEATFTRIGATPEAFPIVYQTVRRAVVPSFPYAIYFAMRPTECVVLAIHHGKRSPRRWMRRGAG